MININDILGFSDEELNNCKLEFNIDDGKRPSTSLLTYWLKLDENDKLNGIADNFYFHNKARQDFKKGNLSIAFLRIPEKNDLWLLATVGIIKTDKKNTCCEYDVYEKIKPLFGRLLIRYHKGKGVRARIRNAFGFLDNSMECSVDSILPSLFQAKEDFEGYNKVHLSFREIDEMIDGKIKPNTLEALKIVSGVYCLTDSKTGKLYIGSAYGENGVAQRWKTYIQTGDGKNKKLIELRKTMGEDYIHDNFSFTLLEVFPKGYDVNKIIEREGYWKECFATRKYGYNNN